MVFSTAHLCSCKWRRLCTMSCGPSALALPSDRAMPVGPKTYPRIVKLEGMSSLASSVYVLDYHKLAEFGYWSNLSGSSVRFLTICGCSRSALTCTTSHRPVVPSVFVAVFFPCFLSRVVPYCLLSQCLTVSVEFCDRFIASR